MYFLKNKIKGNTLILTLYLLLLLSYLSVVTSFLLKKEYEKCNILLKDKNKNSNEIIKREYEKYIEVKGGIKYIVYRKNELIWNKNIIKNENEKTDTGYKIFKIIKKNKIIYDLNKNNKKNYKSLIKNYSDYNKSNEIKIVFIKKYDSVLIGEKQLKGIKVKIIINNSYFYDEDLSIIKNSKSRIGAIYVEK